MTANAAYGTAFAIGDTAVEGTASYTTVAQVRNVSGPSMSGDSIDVTAHDSADGFREYVAGLRDGGEVTLDLIFDPAGATHKNAAGGLAYEYVQRTSKAYKITFPDTTAWTFVAFVTALSPSMPVDGELSASATLKITGKPTLA